MPESEPIVESVRPSRLPVEPFDSTETDISRLAPVREGLPAGFRMRADAHYVDQLDARMSSIPVRLIDASGFSYPSGHSMQSAAAAAVLTSAFGDDFAFEDTTRRGDGLKPRSFASFKAAADEAAISRLYGGIHFRAAIERGQELEASRGEEMQA